MDLDGYNHTRVIFCCNILPVNIVFNDETNNWDCTLDTESIYEEGSMYIEIGRILRQKHKFEIVFVGSPKTFIPQSEHLKVERKLELLNCYPIWIERRTASRYYQGYCQTVLFPVFHNIIEVYGHHIGREKRDEVAQNWNWMPQTSFSIAKAAECWEDYCEVNRLFSLRVVQLYKSGDAVWVNDYHLLVLPSFLFRKVTEAPVTFFLHSPFPSTECFRMLGHREDILRSLLSSDLVGFHTYNYTRSFLLCCKRMLGLKCEPQLGAIVDVHYQSRSIRVMSTLLAVQPSFITKRMPKDLTSGSDAKVYRQQFREKHNFPEGKFVFLSIDILDANCGITPRLIYILKFLNLYGGSEVALKVFFKMYVITPDSGPEKYHREKSNIEILINRINSIRPVVEVIEVQNINVKERIELYNACDGFLMTSITRHLSTLPFEFRLATQYNPGALCISEFEASATVLPGSTVFSPLKEDAFASVIAHAVGMKTSEIKARHARDKFGVEGKTLNDWCSLILFNTFEASKQNMEDAVEPEVFGLGLHLSFMTRKTKTKKRGLRWLNSGKLVEKFKTSKNRVFIFDYAGTLVEITAISSAYKSGGAAKTWHYEDTGYESEGQSSNACLETRHVLPEDVKESIIALAEDQKNHVVIVSSDLRSEVEHVTRDIPNVTLVAENGYVFKMKNSDRWESVIDEKGSGMWYSNPQSLSSSRVSLHPGTDDGKPDKRDTKLANITLPDNPEFQDLDWKQEVLDYMLYHKHLVNGSYCWSSFSSVTFNFYLTDPEWGSIAADALYKGLEGKLAGLPLSIEKGKGYVTVRLAGVNRGAATAAILAKINKRLSLLSTETEEKLQVDFILCAGDDIDDEVNFETVEKYKNKTNSKAAIYNTRVGYIRSKSTKATYFVDDSSDLSKILQALANNDAKMMEDNRDVSIDTSNFITKRSMLNLHKLQQSAATLNTLNSVDSAIETPSTTTPVPTPMSKDGKVTFKTDSAWGNSEAWAQDPDKQMTKSSGLRSRASSLRKRTGLKKNVSFKDVRVGLHKENSFDRKKSLNQSSPDLTTFSSSEDPILRAQRRKVIAHSPSYIATPEELEELFGGAQNLSPDKPNNSEMKLGDNVYNVGIPDQRKIPPTASTFKYVLTEAGNRKHRVLSNASEDESQLNDNEVFEKWSLPVSGSSITSFLVGFGVSFFLTRLTKR